MDQISYFLVEGVALCSVVRHPLESGGYEPTEPSRFITPGHNVWTDMRCLSSTIIKRNRVSHFINLWHDVEKDERDVLGPEVYLDRMLIIEFESTSRVWARSGPNK